MRTSPCDLLSTGSSSDTTSDRSDKMEVGSLVISLITGLAALSTLQIFLVVVAPFVLEIDIRAVYCDYYTLDDQWRYNYANY